VIWRVDLNPSKMKSRRSLVRNVRIDFRTLFFDLVQNICPVRFSYLLRLSIFCKAPRDMRKFPQKCQKIAGCWGRRLWFPTSDRLETWLIPSRTNRSRQISRVNHGLTQLAPVPPLQVLTSDLSRFFCLKRQDKVLEAVVRGQVASDHGWLVILFRQVHSGGDKPGFEAIRGREH